MSGIKWLVDQYLQLPRWERIANLILLGIIFCCILIVNLWPQDTTTKDEMARFDELETTLATPQHRTVLSHKNKTHFKNSRSFKTESTAGYVFITDLNKATVDDLAAAGLSKKAARGMYNYMQNGGKIKSEKDVRKIYGITDQMAVEFLKHVRFANDTSKNTAKNTFGPSEKSIIDLNTADSAALVLIQGISPKMAPYILSFRKSVGQFHSVEQLNEVFKSPIKNFESIKTYVEVKNFKPFIAINTVTTAELKKHRYFKHDNLASVLVAYRDQHGKFKKPEDLKKCSLVTDEVLAKILPYITFE